MRVMGMKRELGGNKGMCHTGLRRLVRQRRVECLPLSVRQEG